MILRCFAILLTILVTLAGMAARAQSTAPATAPTISPRAEAELVAVRDAYASLRSLELAGAITLDLDLMSEQTTRVASFASAYVAPNRFRHETKSDKDGSDAAMIVSTGRKVFFHVVGAHKYVESPAPADRDGFDALDDRIREALQRQNPGLLLSLVADARAALVDRATSVNRLDDAALDGRAFTVLQVEREDDDATYFIDPETHLLRQVRIDLRKRFLNAGVPAVKKALATIDYTRVAPNIDVPENQFTWSPPPDAMLARAETKSDADGPDSPHPLRGKAAPDFTLPDLNDQSIHLADLKGSVVVLDFWATWCAPCREGLTYLDKINSELASKGLKVFAINLREEKAQARSFMEGANLHLPVLLDTKGDVGKAYQVQGIPQTVVIGKDGVVRSVLVGFDPEGGEAKLRKTVEAALRER